MQQPHPVLSSIVIAEKRKAESSGTSLVSCVANILGLKDLKNIPDQASLADLGMDSLMGAEIKQTLERNYDVVMSAADIRQLSFGKLKALGNYHFLLFQSCYIYIYLIVRIKIERTSIETGSGDATAIIPAAVDTSTATKSTSQFDNADNGAIGDGTQLIFTDELIPSECLVKLDSLAPADSKKKPLFAVHAIEGFVTALKPLAAKLNVPVYGLQFIIDAPAATINELAAYYIQQIKTVQATGPYTIIGYSFGASVAFEMVLQLEAAGEEATLVMLDGSPKYVSWYTEAHQHRKKHDDEAYALAYFGMVISGIHYLTTAKELNLLPTFELKLKRIAELVAEKTKFTAEIVELGALAFYKKLYAAHIYKPERKLTSTHVTLVKPTENYVKLAADYGLSEVGRLFPHLSHMLELHQLEPIFKLQIFHKSVQVVGTPLNIVTVKGDHRTILTGDSVEKIASVLTGLTQ